ncbi:hypothetical protein AJ88_21010 [Mesorhizobium amorphae CCBAU 01583]|nr:hypothetical protein AJ88_21010 [Mesorhizobium amorphae CCBAU 01583]
MPQRNFRFAAKSGQRSAEFMTDVGEELDAQPVEVGQSLVRVGEFHCPCGHFLLELRFGIEQPVALDFLVGGHLIEAFGERAEFVAAGVANPVVQFTVADRLGASGQETDWAHQ